MTKKEPQSMRRGIVVWPLLYTLAVFGVVALSSMPVSKLLAQDRGDAPLFGGDRLLPQEGFRVPSRQRDELISIGGRHVHVASDDSTRNVVLVGGSIETEGEVRRDFVVVGGAASINGYVGGEVVVVGGEASFGPDADIRGNTILIGGPFTVDPGARFEGSFNEFPLTWLFPAFDGFRQWLGGTLLLARPFGLNLPGVWWVVGSLFFVNLMILVLLSKPTMRSVAALSGGPVTAFLVGIAVLLLFGPLVVLLVASGFGILLLPFLFCIAAAALLLGKVAVYTSAGQRVLSQVGGGKRELPVLALLVGSLCFLVAYFLPIIGFMTLGLVIPLGVGAVVVAGFQAFRGEVGSRGGGGPAKTVQMASSAPPAASVGSSGAGEEGPAAGNEERGDATKDQAPSQKPDGAPLLTDNSFDRVGFWPRIGATGLDLVLFVVIFGLLLEPSGPGGERLVIFLWLLYHCLMWRFLGTTVGGLFLRLRCVTIDGRSLEWSAALMRTLGSIFSFAALLIGFFWASWGRERQSWHDIIAGTTIVRVPRRRLVASLG